MCVNHSTGLCDATVWNKLVETIEGKLAETAAVCLGRGRDSHTVSTESEQSAGASKEHFTSTLLHSVGLIVQHTDLLVPLSACAGLCPVCV